MADVEQFVPLLKGFVEAANRDQTLARLGRHCSTEFLLEAGAECAYLCVDRGVLVNTLSSPRHLRSYSFAIRATLDTWHRFWSPEPPPGYHDIFAMARFGWARIDGDLDPLLTHLPYFKRFFALPRWLSHDAMA